MTPYGMTLLRKLPLYVGLLAAAACPATAAVIDLRLDIDYAGAVPGTAGTWNLYAKTDEFGLFSLEVPLVGIDSSVTSELPVGRVNGSSSDNAGFSTFVNVASGGGQTLFFAQTVAPGGASEQGVFYGVGTLENGSPAFPSQLSGTNSLGPNITSLTSLQNVPWAVDDPLWTTGVNLASGSFSAGSTPDFNASGVMDGTLLTSIGDLLAPGARSSALEITTLVRTNLDFGVATGDYNGDGSVDAADYTLWRDTQGQSVTPVTGADGDGDGFIGIGDYLVWQDNFGSSAPATALAVAVPEPTGASILLALACLAGARKSCRSAS